DQVPGDHGLLRPSRLLDETVHLPAVHVGPRVVPLMRPAEIHRVGIVMGGDAGPPGICETDVVGEPFRPGIGAEVVIEAPVLLHDEDEVLELLEPDRRRWSPGRTWLMTHAPELVAGAQALGTREKNDDTEGDPDELEPAPRGSAHHPRRASIPSSMTQA